MPGPVDDLEQLVMASVALTARVLADVAPELTFLQWRALVILAEPEDRDGTRIGGLASALGASVSASSRVVRRLESRGFVEGSRAHPDRRVRLVQLTPTGRSLHDGVMERRRAELARIAAAALPGDEAVIRRLARALGGEG